MAVPHREFVFATETGARDAAASIAAPSGAGRKVGRAMRAAAHLIKPTEAAVSVLRLRSGEYVIRVPSARTDQRNLLTTRAVEERDVTADSEDEDTHE